MKKSQVLLAVAAASTLALSIACTKKEETTAAPSSTAPTETPANAPGAAPANAYADVKELKIDELKAGSGTEAVNGKTVSVHYTGWLTNGQKFDSSLDRGEPIEFKLGAGRVIPGWEKGLLGLKTGGKRRLHIPSSLGYGEQGAGGVIPPNATLIFEVELVAVK